MEDRDSVSSMLGAFPQQWRVCLGFPECRSSLGGPLRDGENQAFGQIEPNEEELITVSPRYTGRQGISVLAIKLSTCLQPIPSRLAYTT